MANEEKRKELLEKINKIESHIATLNEQKRKFVYELGTLHSEPSSAIGAASFQVHEPTSILELSTVQKINLFRSLFQGRDDVYARFWKSKKTGKFGYSPVCKNEWIHGICKKPMVRCFECPNKEFSPLNDDVIRSHLEGKYVIGIYPMLQDEAQRIKNWKTRTARSVKQIKSPYAMVLTGTPLENRLEELHSIVEFIDRYRLGPMFRFLNNHQVLDKESGKVIGYGNLKAIGETLSSILIRRKKEEVLKQLPERIDKNFFVSMTMEQMAIHEENQTIVARIVSKWKR